jgi:tRNA-dihydrouridine synthase C
MQGVTDAPMRQLMGELGGFSLCVAEFLRISQVAACVPVVARHVPELRQAGATSSGLPVQVQLLGGDPERLAASAQAAVRAQVGGPALGVDLNFGCPARTVNRHDGGASLLQHPGRLFLIVQAVRQALPPHIAVSAKLRLGWDDPRDVQRNAEQICRAGASWITVHGRTRSQGYRPPAYWHPIGAVRRDLDIPVVANGDLWTLDDLRRCQDATGCEHFMLGRCAMVDPSLALRARAVLLGTPAPTALELNWLQLIQRLIVITQASCKKVGKNPDYLPGRLKQWAKMVHDRRPTAWYERIKRLRSCEEIVFELQQMRPESLQVVHEECLGAATLSGSTPQAC